MKRDIKTLKEYVKVEIDKEREVLIDAAMAIHRTPETAFEEEFAVDTLSGLLESGGMEVKRGIAGLKTAFSAEHGDSSAGPTIGLLGEYDALRGVGHGCGHNIIGTAAVGALLAIKTAVPDLAGCVRFVGTPGEEGGGGKILMTERGAFNDVDAALLCHPSNRNMVMRGGIAAVQNTIRFFGQASHAAVAPEKGVSALDAVLQLFFGINQLRQFAPNGYRIHGIITKGGSASNVVPDLAEAEFTIRARDRRELTKLAKRVRLIAEGAALATGATLEIDEGHVYAERHENAALSEAFATNLTSLGLEVLPPTAGVGSSDMGNVGEVCPIAHPYVKICDEGVEQHTHEFATAACSDQGMNALIDASKALAMTVLDVCADSVLVDKVKEQFKLYQQSRE